MPMYRITIACRGLCDDDGREGPAAILEEFENRPWHTDVTCAWADGVLRISATNDDDHNGQALLDEYGDAVMACVWIAGENSVGFDIESVVELTHGPDR